MIGGGTGPAEGTKDTTVTPGAWHLARMLESLDSWPMNIALLGKGNTVNTSAMWEQLRSGASGFKLHEDWGSTPAAINACLTVADESGVQVALHSDTLNEAGFVEDTVGAIAGRSIHAYHTEGAGGGHAPDIITIAAEPYLHVDADGAPLLRHRIELGAGSATHDALCAPLAGVSELRYPVTAFGDTAVPVGTTLELAGGGCLTTWQGHWLTGSA